MKNPETFWAVLRGESVAARPIIGWHMGANSDAVVSNQARKAMEGPLEFMEVHSPNWLATSNGIDLNELLRREPNSPVLDDCVHQTESRIRDAATKADGIFYVLHGVSPESATPMQYGGHYMESDRNLLAICESLSPTILFLAGSGELYLDFIADFPASAISWDAEETRIPSAQVRKFRTGPLVSSDPESEIHLLLGRECPLPLSEAGADV